MHDKDCIAAEAVLIVGMMLKVAKCVAIETIQSVIGGDPEKSLPVKE